MVGLLFALMPVLSSSVDVGGVSLMEIASLLTRVLFMLACTLGVRYPDIQHLFLIHVFQLLVIGFLSSASCRTQYVLAVLCLSFVFLLRAWSQALLRYLDGFSCNVLI